VFWAACAARCVFVPILFYSPAAAIACGLLAGRCVFDQRQLVPALLYSNDVGVARFMASMLVQVDGEEATGTWHVTQLHTLFT
jgi:hypothetical protein